MTAFREGMAVHGRLGQPCPICGDPIQRIHYTDTETNYCARCQNAGRLRPRTLDGLEIRKRPRS